MTTSGGPRKMQRLDKQIGDENEGEPCFRRGVMLRNSAAIPLHRSYIMTSEREIRACYDRDTVVVYQAYAPQIADAALAHQRFVAPFSFRRMTWIKPSFLWLMHRSNWGRKSNQQCTLAIHIARDGWNKALSLGVLTHPEPSIHPDADAWRTEFQNAQVHIQWDTERSIRGAALNQYSIQVGISRHLIRQYVENWIVKIEDISPTVAKMRDLLKSGNEKHARRLLPAERAYPVDADVAKRIDLNH